MSRVEWIAIIVVGGVIAIATLVGAVILAIKVFRTRRMLVELGTGGKIAFYGALAYTILPIDVLPDPIYLDDMGVLAAALFYLARLAQKQRSARTSQPVRQPRLGPPGPHRDLR